jgi:hypothetical protein
MLAERWRLAGSGCGCKQLTRAESKAYRLPLAQERHPRLGISGGGVMKITLSAITNIVGAATLLLAGYALLKALPDLRRYIKIRTM